MALQAGDVDMAVSIGPGEYGIFQNDKKFTIYEESSLRDVFVRMSQKGKLKNAIFERPSLPERIVSPMQRTL